jgi:hypothetical protein
MKSLSTLIGNVERFFAEYLFYINAKNIVFAYNHHHKQYLGVNLSEEIFNNAQSTIFLWEKGRMYKKQ